MIENPPSRRAHAKAAKAPESCRQKRIWSIDYLRIAPYRLGLSQTAFGQRLYSSAMAVSRWEHAGTQEPTAESYIGLGNLAGDPLCWFFLGPSRPEQRRFDASHANAQGAPHR